MIMNKCFFTLITLIAFVSSFTVRGQVLSERQDLVTSTPGIGAVVTEKLLLELSVGKQNLTDGYGNWRDLTVRSSYKTDQHLLQGEASMNRRFNQDGLFVGARDTYTFDDDLYGSIAVGAGDGAFYLPRYRVDGAIYKKMLSERNLVGSIGAGYYRAPDGHADNILSLGLAYYFSSPWILEGGFRFNSSQPGSVRTRQQFLAATYGRDKHDLFIVRRGWGAEGYLAIAANSQIVNFKSSETSLTWRHWFSPAAGLQLNATRYSNPAYRRSGVNIGLFTSM